MGDRFSYLSVIECCSPAVPQFSHTVLWRMVTGWAGMICSVKTLVIFCNGFMSQFSTEERYLYHPVIDKC